jgi:hypothetical protein
MRVYPEAPRRDYEEALRSVGAALDGEPLVSVMLVEDEDGFSGTALRFSGDLGRAAETVGRYERRKLNFSDADLAAALEHGFGRRGRKHVARMYERSLRLIGRWVDEQHASQLMFLEQAGSFIVRVMLPKPGESPYAIAEFTPDDLDRMADEAGIERRTRDWA